MVKSVLLALSLFLLLLPCAQAEDAPPPSAFFTNPELGVISSEVEKALPKEVRKNDEIKLQAILFFGKDRWKVWLGDDVFTPTDSRHKNIRILSVGPDQIRLSLGGGGPITLHLNEILSLQSKRKPL